MVVITYYCCIGNCFCLSGIPFVVVVAYLVFVLFWGACERVPVLARARVCVCVCALLFCFVLFGLCLLYCVVVVFRSLLFLCVCALFVIIVSGGGVVLFVCLFTCLFWLFRWLVGFLSFLFLAGMRFIEI